MLTKGTSVGVSTGVPLASGTCTAVKKVNSSTSTSVMMLCTADAI